MIFVNDLWTLVDIPDWLGHTAADTDGMGLADFIFPAFLFIVGLSIPYAIDGRLKKGESTVKIITHICWRTIALLTMGLFLVNAEVYAEGGILPKNYWMLLLIIGFFLVWLDYQNPKSRKSLVLKAIGITLLVVLALLYKTESDSGLSAFKIHWWGILGLIGWAYLVSSLCYLLTKGSLLWQIIALIFFILISVSPYFGWLSLLNTLKNEVWIIKESAMYTLSTAGVIISVLYRKKGAQPSFWIYLSVMALALIIFGFATRPIWGISKIKATPSWTTICAGLSMVCIGIFIFITDVKNKVAWYKVIKPAGSSTLTCYLLPYLHYALLGFISFRLPLLLRTGEIGLLKSMLYAMLIISIVGILEKVKIRLRI